MTNLDKLPKNKEVRDRAPTLGKVERHPHRRAVVGGILGTVALSSGLLGYNLLGRGEDTNAAPNPETTTSAEYNTDEPSNEASESADRMEIINQPQHEGIALEGSYEENVAQVRINPEQVSSGEDLVPVIEERFSEWLTAGATIENRNRWLATYDSGDGMDVYEFAKEIAQDNRLVYQEALFGITPEEAETHLFDQKTVQFLDYMQEQNETVLWRFFISLSNEDFSEAYWAEMHLDSVESVNDLNNEFGGAIFHFDVETNGDAYTGSQDYQEPFGGNGEEVNMEIAVSAKQESTLINDEDGVEPAYFTPESMPDDVIDLTIAKTHTL